MGPQAFAPGATAKSSYVVPFAAGNNFGWDQQVDIRTFQAGDGSTLDLNHDGIADFVGMGPQGLAFAYGNTNGGEFGLGALQTAQIDGSSPDLGDAQGWNNATTQRDIITDPQTGFDDILAFGAAGVYVAMGQDANTHDGQPFGQLYLVYLAMPDFGLTQGWSVSQTPRIVGDVNGDGIPDIVGFGADSTSSRSARATSTAISASPSRRTRRSTISATAKAGAAPTRKPSAHSAMSPERAATT